MRQLAIHIICIVSFIFLGFSLVQAQVGKTNYELTPIRDCGMPPVVLKSGWDSAGYKMILEHQSIADAACRNLFGDAFYKDHIRLNLDESYGNPRCENKLDSCYDYWIHISEPIWYQVDLCLDSCYCGNLTFANFHYNFQQMMYIRFSEGARFFNKEDYNGKLITKKIVDSLALVYLKLEPGEFVFAPFITYDKEDWSKCGKLRIKLHAPDATWETPNKDFINEGKYIIVDAWTYEVLEKGDPKKKEDLGSGYENSSVRRGKREDCYSEPDTTKCFLLNKYRYKADSLMLSIFGADFLKKHVSLNMHSSELQDCYGSNIDSCDDGHGNIKTWKWPITYYYDFCIGEKYCGHMLRVGLDYENNLTAKIWKGANYYQQEKHTIDSLITEKQLIDLAYKELKLGPDEFYIYAYFSYEANWYYEGIPEKSGRLLLLISAPNKEWYDGGYRYYETGKHIVIDPFTKEILEKKGTKRSRYKPTYY